VYVILVGYLYVFILFLFLFVKTPGVQDVNFNPVDFLRWNYKILSQAIMNVICFVPLGWLYGKFLSRGQMLIVALALSCSVEAIQFFYHLGVLAVSDVLLNVAGSWLGWWMLRKDKLKKGSIQYF